MNNFLNLLFCSFFVPMGLLAQSIKEPNALSSDFPLPDYVQPSSDYPRRDQFMWESSIKPNYDIHEMKVELNENSAISEFNQLVNYSGNMKNITSKKLESRILLFQTVEQMRVKRIALVYSPSDSIHFVQPDSSQRILQTIVYNDFVQRDIFVMRNDSTRVTNWYVKRLNPTEIEACTNKRSVFQHEIDSLKLSMRDMAAKGESRWGLKMDGVRKQITSRNQVLDTLDFLVYPSIKDSIESFQTKFNRAEISKRIDFQAMNISRYGNHKAGSDEIAFSQGEKAVFTAKHFRLICVIGNDIREQSAYYGDSTIYSGSDILTNWMYEDLTESSSEWDRSLIAFDGKYLIVESSETYIGETYRYGKSRRYWFELVE